MKWIRFMQGGDAVYGALGVRAYGERRRSGDRDRGDRTTPKPGGAGGGELEGIAR